MKIYLREITPDGVSFDFAGPFVGDDAWVIEAVRSLDEWHSDEPGLRNRVKAQEPEAHFTVRQVDEVYVMDGRIHADLQLICSRCGRYASFAADAKFSALFCQDPEMAGIAHLRDDDERGSRGAPGPRVRRPAGQNRGFARHEHDTDNNNLEITYLSEDYIDLREVLVEQLRLQVPFQPLCEASCKGVCVSCGADLNVGRCACLRLTAAHPFAALESLKLRKSQES